MKNTQTPLRTAAALARSVMERYTAEKVRWHYEHGLFLQSLLRLGTALEDPSYEDFVVSRIDLLVDQAGRIASYRMEEYNLDQVNPGKVLLELYQRSGSEKYQTAVKTLREQLRYQPRTAAGGFWHKNIYPHQIWLDGQYMQGPFLARYARDFHEPELFDDVSGQLLLTEEKTRDTATGLLYHAWDESREQRWADPRSGCSPHFWGRAMGWFSMALVDVLDYLPADHPNRGRLLGVAERTAAAILRVRDERTGLWYQVLDQGGRERNYLETSASSLFACFLAKAAQNGYLNNRLAEQGRQAAESAVRSLIDEFLRSEPDGALHMHGICSVAGLGGTPYRDGSYDYYVNEPVAVDDFKGVGPFILACVETGPA